jgi:hypothetical protein
MTAIAARRMTPREESISALNKKRLAGMQITNP